MKIALAQNRYTIGDLESNAKKIIDQIEKAQRAGADLIIFSELSISGYPPQDLLTYHTFVKTCYLHLLNIAKACTNIGAIVGTPLHTKDNKDLLNSAVLLHQGRIETTISKTLLPPQNIADEYRYFKPAAIQNCIQFKNKTIALTIGKDITNTTSQIKASTLTSLMAQQPDFIINIAAQAFDTKTHDEHIAMLCQQATQYKLPLVYVNQVGGQTDILYAGNSTVINAKGKPVKTLACFKEDFTIVDMETINNMPHLSHIPTNKIALIHDALVMGIRDYFYTLEFKTAVLGLSGGIDSAVCMALAAEALGAKNVKAILLPSQYSSNHSIQDAKDLAENLSSPYDIIPIENSYHTINQSLSPIFKNLPFGIAEENIQARIRGLILMAVSNKFGPILLNTSNKSEAAVGYGTLYGDTNGGLSVLGDVYKTDVFSLARYINRNGEVIPEHTITKSPSAELRPNQKDSDSLPDYDTLDSILYQYIEMQKSSQEIIALGFDADTVHFTIQRVNMNEYKRHQLAPALKVSYKSFGIERRMPIVAKYTL